MPIKEQCEQCRYQYDGHCTQHTPSFDGTSCGTYRNRINLEKTDSKSESDVTARKDPENYSPDINPVEADTANVTPSDESIHGWLTFFLVVFVGIGGFGSLILNLVGFESGEIFWFSVLDVVASLIYLTTGIFTIVAFHKRDTDAVFLAKTFTVMCAASNLLVLFVMYGADFSKEIVGGIRSIIWSCIWFAFLCCSSQVKRLIPEPYRKTKNRDWILIGSIVLVWMTTAALTVPPMIKNDTNAVAEAEILADLTLASNQYSDGRIIITIPDSAYCEESNDNDYTAFVVTDTDTGAEVTVASDYADEVAQETFDEYWRMSNPEDLKDLTYRTIEDETLTRGDITVFNKKIRIEAYTDYYWNFALVFDRKTGKMCILSDYSFHEDDPLYDYLLDNLKFL